MRAAPRRAYRRARTGLAGLGKGLSIKGLVTGVAGIALMKKYNPYGGEYKPAIDKIVPGVVLPMIKMDNHDLLTAGIKEALATAVDTYLLGGGYAHMGDSL